MREINVSRIFYLYLTDSFRYERELNLIYSARLFSSLFFFASYLKYFKNIFKIFVIV